jgi:uncharacterized protein YkwD
LQTRASHKRDNKPYLARKQNETVRHILVLALALLSFLVVAVTPWPTIKQALIYLTTSTPSTTTCPALPPSPNYYSSGAEAAAIAAINHARASEGLPALTLPGNYWQLSPPQEQFILVNLERTSRGLTPLRWDTTLAQIATAYSRQMAQLHFFAHTSPISGDFQDRLNANPQIANHYQAIAEDIAGNWVPAAGALYEYLYNDAAEHCSHRQNILNPHFSFIGIGMAPGGPWRVMSAQELLASNPANPYIGAPPDTTPPTIILHSALSTSARWLSVSTTVSDNQGIARVSWYLDNVSKPGQQGPNWILDADTLAPGTHLLTVYAVDESQNYTTATLSFMVGAEGITLHQ